MASAWLLSVLCFGFAADAVLCAASLSRTLAIPNPMMAASLVLRLNAALWRVFRDSFSPIPFFNLSTSAAL
jgi:hypothetical protein